MFEVPQKTLLGAFRTYIFRDTVKKHVTFLQTFSCANKLSITFIPVFTDVYCRMKLA